jgi:uncharacterized membrane protein YdjX (TVP38/TMEM64 family)
MDWLTPLVLKVLGLGPWAPLLFVLVYVLAALAVAPAFFLTVAAGAVFGVWQGSVLVFTGASLGALAVYAVAARLTRTRWMRRITADQRVAAVRHAVAGGGLRIIMLLRLSPIVPYTILNYALALSGVRLKDYVVGFVGMIPAVIMYTYYGKVVGDVAALAAGASPPRGPEYYILLAVGLVSVVVSTTMISRAAREEIERHRRG